MGTGWSYLRIPDPGNGAFRLVSVTRSDSLNIPLDINAWTTDRTFIGQGQEAIRENILHLVDHDSTGAYTLTYIPVPLPDTTAPISSISMLPDDSGEFIELAWTGTDDSGITGFDIYVSTDGGPFILWLENTPDTGALFDGIFGSSYAFYSIGHDAAGNDEAAKSVGETSTSVTLVNQPPELDPIPNLPVNEGVTLIYQVVASDPDAPDDLLRFSVDSPDPGIVINPLTGLLRWITSESDGGSSIPVTVTVTDGAATPGTASQSFTVDVASTNKAPRLADPGSHVLDVGELLSVQLTATDADVPAQSLAFRFASTAPTGMTLAPVTGLLEWTPGDEHEVQTFEVRIEVFDDETPEGFGAATLRVEVLEKPGLPPAFDDIPTLVWVVGGSYSYRFHAADPEGQPVTVTADASALPGWTGVRDDSADGTATLLWNTTGVPTGVYELTLKANTLRQETVITQGIEIVPRDFYSDYTGWADAYGLGAENNAMDFIPNPQGTVNLISYALGIDPIGGIIPSQPEPRPHVVINALGVPALRFLMPFDGRPDLRYRIEHNTGLLASSWSVAVAREGSGNWIGSAAVATEAARGGLVWATVTPIYTSQSRGFIRLVVDRISAAGLTFETWPGTMGGTREERAIGDPNSDGFNNLEAYAMGASSAGVSVFSEGIIYPVISHVPGGSSIAGHLAGLPREDIVYMVETSDDGLNWAVIGWWSTDSSDQSNVTFSVEPTTDGGTDMSAIWSSAAGSGSFARLRFEFR